MMRLKRVAVALLSVAVLSCSGCAAGAGAGKTDAFSGPWGATLKSLRDKSDNQVVRKVLEDGVINDAEQAQIESDMTQCMADLGYEWKYIDNGDGGEELSSTESTKNDDPEEANRLKEKCGKSTGFDPLLELARQMRNNPEHKNPQEPIFQCLQRKELIDKSLTLDEYISMLEDSDTRYKILGPYEDTTHPDYDQQKARTFQQCVTAPQE